MFRSKIIICITIFITFLVLTSAIKNKTRIIEKQIIHLNNKILLQKKILMKRN